MSYLILSFMSLSHTHSSSQHPHHTTNVKTTQVFQIDPFHFSSHQARHQKEHNPIRHTPTRFINKLMNHKCIANHMRGSTSTQRQFKTDFPQACVISHTLFFISNINTIHKHKHYADDMSIIVTRSKLYHPTTSTPTTL